MLLLPYSSFIPSLSPHRCACGGGPPPPSPPPHLPWRSDVPSGLAPQPHGARRSRAAPRCHAALWRCSSPATARPGPTGGQRLGCPLHYLLPVIRVCSGPTGNPNYFCYSLLPPSADLTPGRCCTPAWTPSPVAAVADTRS